MNQPQETDPCASIRQEIEDTQRTLNEDRFDLSHPEDLTTEQEAALKREVEELKRKLARLKRELTGCLEQNQHSEGSQTVPAK